LPVSINGILCLNILACSAYVNACALNDSLDNTSLQNRQTLMRQSE